MPTEKEKKESIKNVPSVANDVPEESKADKSDTRDVLACLREISDTLKKIAKK